MSWEAYVCLAVIALVFVGLARNMPPDGILLGAVIFLAFLGVVTPQEAFAGFANKGMLTVGALYVVAGALRETGALSTVGAWVLGRAKTERGVLLRLAGSVTAMSAFLNNTPIVAMFIPVITDWCKKNNKAPSRLLIPLSYLCILGGTCTLIGTSTNLVVNGLMEQASAADASLGESLRPMKLFELGSVGLPYALIGIVYLFFVAQRLLPERKGFLETATESSRSYLANMQVQPGCALVGKTVQGAGLRQLPGLFLIEIVRGNQTIAPVSPSQVLAENDVLTFAGVVSTIVDLKRIPALIPVADEGYEAKASKRRSRMLCEAVVSGTSPCLGKTIRDAEFRATYNAAVVAVHRGGERLRGKVGDVVLRAGDTLLLQTGPHFIRANRNNPDFLLTGGVEDYRPVRADKAATSLVLLVLLVGLMASGVIDIVLAAFLAAGLMIVTRCIAPADARRSVDWQTLITIGAAFGLGKALVNSGCVAAIAEFFVATTGRFGPYAVLASVYLMTSMFTETVTNNAAAALVFPFAVAMAQQMEVSPRPFVMAVAFAASASFMTPLGYQTNLMVYGPGGYRFSDFVRIGLPLNLILVVTATVLVPIAWPFFPE